MQNMNAIRPKRKLLYEQVVDYVYQQLALEVYKPEDVLPSEWALADTLGVSQGTVRKGLDELVKQGVLFRQQGIGTFVAKSNPEWGELYLQSSASNKKIPLLPRAESLGISVVHAMDDVADMLQVKRNAMVWKHLVLWRQGINIVAVDEAYLLHETWPDLNVQHAACRYDLYHLLWLRYGLKLKSKKSLLNIAHLDRDMAYLLKTDVYKPVLQLTRLSYSQDNEIVEWRRRFVLLGQYQLGVK